MHPISAIANPETALLTIAAGACGVYCEFCSPGRIAPGVLGATLILAGLASLLSNPIDWHGAALIIVAFGLFSAEAKLNRHGILTLCGAASLMVGSMLLIDSPDPRLHIRWTIAAAVTIPFALLTVFLLSVAERARGNKFGDLSGANRYPERDPKL